MKTFLSLMTFISANTVLATDVHVQGYQRSDGTYVAPHFRSAPDSSKWNNYGSPSSQDQLQQQQYNQRDYDEDSILNQYDRDDDNDGIYDDFE